MQHLYNFIPSYDEVMTPDAPLRGVVEDYLSWAARDRPRKLLSEDTIRTYRLELLGFLAFVGQDNGKVAVLADLNPANALAYTQPFRRTKPHRAKNKVIALRSFAGYLAQEGLYYLGSAPENGLRATSVLHQCAVPRGGNDGEGRWPYTKDEVERIFSLAKSYPKRSLMHRAVLAIAAMQGTRRKDFRLLKFRNLHLPDRPGAIAFFSIKRDGTKTDAGARRIVLEPQVLRLIKAYINAERPAYQGHSPEAETLFLNRMGRPYTTNGWQTLWQRFRRYLEASGFPEGEFKLHRMRNTWAVDQLRHHVPETVIAAQGGWEHTDMIKRYANKLPVDVLSEYTGQGTKYQV